jgi:formylglycine-generating enzyme required for sulfatase activity
MVLIPRTTFLFQTGGVEIEGGCDSSQDAVGTGNCCTREVTCPSNDTYCVDMCAFAGADVRGVDVQFPWESTPRRFHSREIDVGPFYIDRTLVTQKQYAVFLNATAYRPADAYNFLKVFDPESSSPVVWVGLQEARDYCAWAGKRLPHAYEWQLAAQGTDGREYPWGNGMDASRIPEVSHGRDVPILPSVGSFPAGDSPFGLSDMVGLVWQFTDEFRDLHTRSALLKGTSLYNPLMRSGFPSESQPGNWYHPTARKLTQHNRLLLMDLSYERAGTVGFRCVGHHPDQAAGPSHLHEPTDVFQV